MLGYPVLMPLSFSVIELMSSPRFDIKQIGYLAASQSFSSGTEVILLTNNLIKKVLYSCHIHMDTILFVCSHIFARTLQRLRLMYLHYFSLYHHYHLFYPLRPSYWLISTLLFYKNLHILDRTSVGWQHWFLEEPGQPFLLVNLM